MRAQTDAVEDAYKFATHLAGSGCRKTEVRQRLTNRGLGRALARAVASDAFRGNRGAARRAAAGRTCRGTLALLLGISGGIACLELLGSSVACALPAGLALVGLVELLRGVWGVVRAE